MIKIQNYRCQDCGEEYERIDEEYSTPDMLRCECSGLATRFDFKNNGHRVRIND